MYTNGTLVLKPSGLGGTTPPAPPGLGLVDEETEHVKWFEDGRATEHSFTNISPGLLSIQ